MSRAISFVFLLSNLTGFILAQANTNASQPSQRKRSAIGLSDSQPDGSPLPIAAVEPLGGTGSPSVANSSNTPGSTEPRTGEFIFAPIPISNQALGVGVIPMVAYVFFPSQSDHLSPPSTLVLAGIYTSTTTYGIGLGGNLILKENRYRIGFLLGAARARYEFFGIGNDAGNVGHSFRLSQHGHAVLLQGMKRFKWDIFVGPRFTQRQIRASGESSSGDTDTNLPQFVPIQPQLNLAVTSAGFGLRVDRDKRDDTFYPRRGSRIGGQADFLGPYVGSTFSFRSYQFEANKYLPLGNRQVLALRGMGCGVSGNLIPFFELCQFGMMGDLRGYQLGRYRDRTMFATQAEWRVDLWKRLGGSVFGGVGEVAPQWTVYNTENLLPSGGVGLRYNLSKQRRINLRLDLACSKTGASWSMGVGEVF